MGIFHRHFSFLSSFFSKRFPDINLLVYKALRQRVDPQTRRFNFELNEKEIVWLMKAERKLCKSFVYIADSIIVSNFRSRKWVNVTISKISKEKRLRISAHTCVHRPFSISAVYFYMRLKGRIAYEGGKVVKGVLKRGILRTRWFKESYWLEEEAK